MRGFFKKTIKGLIPTTENKYYDKLKLGEEVEVEIRKPRNIGHHRKFFSLLNLVFQNQDEFDNMEDFRAVFTMRMGYYRIVPIFDRKTGSEKAPIYLPKSISFANMDQLEFDDFYNKALDVAYDLIGVEQSELRDALSDY